MKYIVPVISGKGGVGKSTIAVNLAIALGARGLKVSLIDSDFYGPSIPTLMGGGVVAPDEEGKIIPPEKFGIKYISIGFFLRDKGDPVIWRGPMFHKAIAQLFEDVRWGDIDICIVDMPPGTGDAQLSLAQNVSLSGAIVVTTPQEVALADVRKAINMLIKVEVPPLGIVENMSGFVAPDGAAYEIFGKGGGVALANEFGIPLLASIPIDLSLRKGGDVGEPIACDKNSPLAVIFHDLGAKIVELLESGSKKASSLKIVN